MYAECAVSLRVKRLCKPESTFLSTVPKNESDAKTADLGRKKPKNGDLPLLGTLGRVFGRSYNREDASKKKNYKDPCVKRTLSKSRDVCRTCDAIRQAYADLPERDPGKMEFRCSALLAGPESGGYASYFLGAADRRKAGFAVA